MKKFSTPFLIVLCILGFLSASIYYRHTRQFASAEYSKVPGRKVPSIFSFLNSLELVLYDRRISNRNPEVAKHVFVAEIDEAAVARYGRWPWNRYVYKEILNELYGLGAEVVGFDAVFSEAEWTPETIDYTLKSKPSTMSASVSSQANLTDQQLQIIKELIPQVGEADFADGLRGSSTVLGYLWPEDTDCTVISDEEKDVKGKRGFKLKEFVDEFSTIASQSISDPTFPFFNDSKKIRFPSSRCVVGNRSALGASASYQGYFNSTPDLDGIYRRMYPLYALNASTLVNAIQGDDRDFLNSSWFKDANFFPSLSLRSVMAYLDRQDKGPEGSKTEIVTHLERRDSGDLQMQGFDIVRKTGEKIFVPTNPDGSLSLRFYGSQHLEREDQIYPIGAFSLAYPTGVTRSEKFRKAYHLDDLSRPLKNSIVLIGPTAIGIADQRPNPTDGTAPGVFLHATSAARILAYTESKDLRDLSLRNVSQSSMQFVLWGCGLLLFLLSIRFEGVGGIWLYFFYLLCLVLADLYFFINEAVVIDSMTLGIAFTSTYLTVAVYKYLTEEKERAYIKNKFKSSVSPEIVEAMLKDPESMKGKKAELSVFFSDIRGFTTISESLTAVQLADFMNSYLSPMTDIVFKHGGTLDKYMGDAIMAIFGAPIFFPNHAERVVDSALDQMKKLFELKAQWKKQGLPQPLLDMDIGIGINTGEVSVGMMGSQTLSSYTVMGDNVNLASRLEGLNKEYGSHVIVSEFTHARLPREKFVTRRLDRVKVKGKNKPVEIYEVYARRGEAQGVAEHFGDFEKALALYFEGRFQEALPTFLQFASQDAASELFAERCQIFVQEGAPKDWDGAWTMTTK